MRLMLPVHVDVDGVAVGDDETDSIDMRVSSESANALVRRLVGGVGTEFEQSLSKRAGFPVADAPIFNATSAYNTESTIRFSARVSLPPPVRTSDFLRSESRYLADDLMFFHLV